jgi:hypothetical protein
MVNRMLRNNIPQSKIVGALDEHGIKVTERNVSNWKTRGGYAKAADRLVSLADLAGGIPAPVVHAKPYVEELVNDGMLEIHFCPDQPNDWNAAAFHPTEKGIAAASEPTQPEATNGNPK